MRLRELVGAGAADPGRRRHRSRHRRDNRGRGRDPVRGRLRDLRRRRSGRGLPRDRGRRRRRVASRPMRHPFQTWPPSRRRLALVCLTVLAVLPVALGTVVHPSPRGQARRREHRRLRVRRIRGPRAGDPRDVARRRGDRSMPRRSNVRPGLPADLLGGLGRPLHRGRGSMEPRRRSRLAAAGIAMAWVAFAAAGFDYVEKLGLGSRSGTSRRLRRPQVSFVAAVLKFAAIYASLLYALSGLVGTLVARRARVVLGRSRPASRPRPECRRARSGTVAPSSAPASACSFDVRAERTTAVTGSRPATTPRDAGRYAARRARRRARRR